VVLHGGWVDVGKDRQPPPVIFCWISFSAIVGAFC
jgi:hypothetical protein